MKKQNLGFAFQTYPKQIPLLLCVLQIVELGSAATQSSVNDVIKSSAIHEVCTSHSDCPAHSSCRPSGCDGYNCLCDREYVASPDRTRCLKGTVKFGKKKSAENKISVIVLKFQ